MGRRTTLADANRVVEEFIDKALKRGSTRLASLREMSTASGVSHPLLMKAVRGFAEQGILAPRPGAGTFITSPPAHVSSDTPRAFEKRGKLFERIAQDLIADIRQNTFGHGTRLPTISYLKDFYSVSYRTMRKALDRLSAQHMITDSRHLTVKTTGTGRKDRLVVVCLIRVSPSGTPAPEVQHDVMVLQELCTRRNLQLLFVRLTYQGKRVCLFAREDTEKLSRIPRNRVLGVILSLTAIHDVEGTEIIPYANSFGRPIAVIDDLGDTVALRGFSALKNVRLFRNRSGVVPGTIVGSYLLSHGHRKIAYISSTAHTKWSQNRLRGLREAYRVAGLTGGITEVRFSPYSRTARAELQQGMREHSRELQRYLEQRQLPLGDIHHVVGGLISSTRSLDEKNRTSSLLPAHLDQLADNSAITAWVCATDKLAVECLRYCRKCNMQVPRDISIVGFDDSFDAFTHDLTSFNFNRTVQLGLVFDRLHEGQWGSQQPHPVIDDSVERVGYVTERGTVRDLNGRA